MGLLLVASHLSFFWFHVVFCFKPTKNSGMVVCYSATVAFNGYHLHISQCTGSLYSIWNKVHCKLNISNVHFWIILSNKHFISTLQKYKLVQSRCHKLEVILFKGPDRCHYYNIQYLYSIYSINIQYKHVHTGPYGHVSSSLQESRGRDGISRHSRPFHSLERFLFGQNPRDFQ